MLMTRGSNTQLNNAADHTALLKLQGVQTFELRPG